MGFNSEAFLAGFNPNINPIEIENIKDKNTPNIEKENGQSKLI